MEKLAKTFLDAISDLTPPSSLLNYMAFPTPRKVPMLPWCTSEQITKKDLLTRPCRSKNEACTFEAPVHPEIGTLRHPTSR